MECVERSTALGTELPAAWRERRWGLARMPKLEWARWTESGVFQQRGRGRAKGEIREYATLFCPLCRQPESCVVLKARLVNLRPRAVRDHLRECTALTVEQRAGFARTTKQQRDESAARKQGSGESKKERKREAKREAKEAAAAAEAAHGSVAEAIRSDR